MTRSRFRESLQPRRQWHHAWCYGVVALIIALGAAIPVRAAIEAIIVSPDIPALDITELVDVSQRSADRIQVATAPGSDGLVRRIEVRAQEAGRDSYWAVFALTNNSDNQIDRLVVSDYYRLVGSGIFWPDLGASRIIAITPSQGFRPERLPNENADIFQITLDPGSTVTYVVELASSALPRIYLWQADAYKDQTSNFILFQGIVIGISGMLALFLTTVFVVRGTVMFPTAALFAWSVLAYLSIDFGFWYKMFAVSAADNPIYRAGAEAMLAATLLIFLLSYLHLYRWHVRIAYGTAAWAVIMLGLVALAVYQAPIVAGLARLSMVLIGVFGFAIIIFLSLRRYDRAIMLIPTWLLLLGWLYVAIRAVLGEWSDDFVAPGLAGGLVMIVLLIAFTVTQHAFAGGVALRTKETDTGTRALALMGSGEDVWNWDLGRNLVGVGIEFERMLNVTPGYLGGDFDAWLQKLHSADRGPFRSALETAVHRRGGRIDEEVRVLLADDDYAWLRIRARPLTNDDGEVIRCIGTVSDITDQRKARDRLLHDAVHDSLTGLPNRPMFFDRIQSAITRARNEKGVPRPTLLVIDFDRFRDVNESVGVTGGDSVLLTVARRLARHLKPQDSLARLNGDQFVILLLSEQEPKKIAAFAENTRRTLKAAFSFSDREVYLNTSIGIALFDERHVRAEDMYKEAEIALHCAKQKDTGKIEAYKRNMQSSREDRVAIDADLRRAVARDEILVLYQPIVRLRDFSVAGFEALVRWRHPVHGIMQPDEFISIAEESEFINTLGLHVLDKAAHQLRHWQMHYPSLALFASVNMSSRQLLRQNLISDIRSILSRSNVVPKSMKIELTESLVMQNPEYSADVLRRLRDLGAGLSLDDFGTGYSSLSYLEIFPFDTVKIDKSFVQVDSQGARPTLLRSIVSMAHDLDMEVVAEGAESTEDAHDLYDYGCEFAQGFYFGRPATAGEAEKLLNDAVKERPE